MVRLITRPAGVEFLGPGFVPVSSAAPRTVDAWRDRFCPKKSEDFAETPGQRLKSALARFADTYGIVSGISEAELATEAKIPQHLAAKELWYLIISGAVMAFDAGAGPVWVLPEEEDLPVDGASFRSVPG